MAWKIAVLGIALHCTLLMIPQQGLLDGLVVGSSLLQASALVLLTIGMVLAAVKYIGADWSWSGRARPGLLLARLSAQSSPQIMMRGTAWMMALGLEGILAAQIIQVSMAYIGQHELSWARIAILVIVALSRVLL